MEQAQALADLMANIHNLEISIMALNTRLSLAEVFSSQLAQGQFDMKEVLKKLMNGSQQQQGQTDLRQMVSELVKTVDQMKVTQKMLGIRLKETGSK